MVFPGVQKSTWSYDHEAKAWYFHRFYDFQPDLNTSHPEVQAEILKIMGFWIQLGVSGFRMDAVPFIIASKGPNVGKPQEQYDMLRRFREFVIVALANSRAGYITADLRPTRKNLLADGGRAIHFGKENYRAKAKRFAAAVTFTGAGQQDVVRGEPSREPEEQSQDS
jgi:glycosidase